MSDKLQLDILEPQLTHIKSGLKLIEGQVGPFTKFNQFIGREIVMHNSSQRVTAMLLAVRHYNTLDEYLIAEKWFLVEPHLRSYDEAYRAYELWYDVRDSYGNVIIKGGEKIQSLGGINALILEVI